jgi:hypothetical protein
VAESYVEESIANKISISNKILGIGENQPSTSSTTRAENEMGTSSQLPSTAKSSQPQVPNSLPKIIVKNCTYCKMDVQWRARNFAHIGHFTGIILLKCDTGDSFVPV